METHPCTEICSKKEATAKNIFRFLEIRKLTYENKIREAFKKQALRSKFLVTAKGWYLQVCRKF